MSWLWRDELRVLLTPQRVALQRRARGLGAAVAERQSVAIGDADAFHWEAAVAALDDLLAARPRKGADAVVVLSNHFVRYTLVPPNDLLVTREDELLFAQQDFARIYGPAAERWHVALSAGGDGPSVASGVAADLVDALRATLTARGLRPKSLQPGLMAAFNAARTGMPAGAVRLLAVEPGMAVSALLAPSWVRVRSQRMGPAEDIDRIVQHERALDETAVEDEAVCVLPLTRLAVPEAIEDGTRLHVMPPLWDAPQEQAMEQAA